VQVRAGVGQRVPVGQDGVGVDDQRPGRGPLQREVGPYQPATVFARLVEQPGLDLAADVGGHHRHERVHVAHRAGQ
jgi:hypothetical protein